MVRTAWQNRRHKDYSHWRWGGGEDGLLKDVSESLEGESHSSMDDTESQEEEKQSQ